MNTSASLAQADLPLVPGMQVSDKLPGFSMLASPFTIKHVGQTVVTIERGHGATKQTYEISGQALREAFLQAYSTVLHSSETSL